MASINLKVENIVIDVKEPVADKEKWVTISELKYRPDKDRFILDKFKKDYAHINVSSADVVYKLASRSSTINNWLAEANVDYARTATEPSYLKGKIEPKAYEAAAKIIQKVNTKEADRAKAIKQEAEKFDAKVKEINQKYDREIKGEIGDSKIVKILTLTVNKLPVSIALAIENFSAKSNESATDGKAYGREMLVSYKMALLDYIKENPDTDVDKLIDEMSTKQ